MNRAGYWLLAFFLVLSLRDVFSNSGKQSHDENAHDADFAKEFDDEQEHDQDTTAGNAFSTGDADDHIEVREAPLMSGGVGSTIKDLPPLRFAYCVSCGYRQAFDQFSQFVREKYPHIQIEGGNYPPAAWKTYTAQFIGIAKMALLVMVVMGQDPFAAMGRATPGLLTWAHGNKISACMMVFLVSNMIEGSLMSTGAFEIYLGETQLWSKLESGRVPSPQELLQMIDSHLELTGKIPAKAVAGDGFDFEFEK